MRTHNRFLTSTLCIALLGACAASKSKLAPVVDTRPAEAPAYPPALEEPPVRKPSGGLLRGRDVAAGERQDSVSLAEQRRRQRDLTAMNMKWMSLDSVDVDHDVLFRWKEIRSGLPHGARFNLLDVSWPTRAQVIQQTDTLITIRADAISSGRLGSMEYRGDGGGLTLEIKLRPGKSQEWIKASLHVRGPDGQVSDRFRSRLRSVALQIPLLLNSWVLDSRTQTTLDLR